MRNRLPNGQFRAHNNNNNNILQDFWHDIRYLIGILLFILKISPLILIYYIFMKNFDPHGYFWNMIENAVCENRVVRNGKAKDI